MSVGDKRTKDPLKKRRMRPTYIVLLVCIVIAIGARVYASRMYVEEQSANVPKLALNTWVGDLRAYYMQKGAFPESLVKLEAEVWLPRRKGGQPKDSPPPASVLQSGPRMLLSHNYLYLYTRDEKNPLVCSVWAIPQGEKRSEANTVFLIVTVKSVEHWRGAALSDEQYKAIPNRTIPTYEEMARLGMTKQAANLQGPQQKSIWQRILPF